ncbi:MAG: hypothetical protein E2P05_09125 [Acidobacteria bacterium]|nr:MAG: hypothetical protein E2P05_09125 [Acidobacteriota bacterium]
MSKNKTDRGIDDIKDLARSLIGVWADYILPANRTKPNHVSDTISDLESIGEEIKKRSTALWEQAKMDYPEDGQGS